MPLDEALDMAVRHGFLQVALAARADRPADELEVLADSGLMVAGAWLGSALPAGCALDVADRALRRQALDVLKRQLADAARLGATFALLAVGVDRDPSAQAFFVEAGNLLGEYAAARKVRLCIGPATEDAADGIDRILQLLQVMPSLSVMLDFSACPKKLECCLGALDEAGPRAGCVLVNSSNAADLLSRLHAAAYHGPVVVEGFADDVGATSIGSG